jgi:hypothetical protein
MKDLVINGKTVGSFEIVRYNFQIVSGEPKILISQVKVLDVDGKYIKFAKCDGVIKYLSLYPVTFKKLE